ncbi:MAG: GspH/FimT family pseudopilin [Xanthomonadales bacterium]|nr:GspH/FimT family pseudopilin [Xanthomonadales bacterium]
MTPFTKRPPSGVTLIELMIVLVILGIGTALALPAFNDVIRQSRVSSEVNELLAAINLTRSEALKRGQTVLMCGSSDQATCTGDFSGGWIVWNDANFDNAVQNAEIITVRSVLTERVELAGSVDRFGFDRRGLRMAAADVSFQIQPHACVAGKLQQRRIDIGSGGRVTRTEAGACP